MTALLETRGVWQRFGGLIANSDVSISVERGEIVGLIGPNGAGKTTLFNVITRLYRPDAGDEIEQRRLAGTVRPDQTDDLAAADRDRDIAVGDEAAEPLPDAAGFKERSHRVAPFAFERANRLTNPCGKASEIATISVP